MHWKVKKKMERKWKWKLLKIVSAVWNLCAGLWTDELRKADRKARLKRKQFCPLSALATLLDCPQMGKGSEYDFIPRKKLCAASGLISVACAKPLRRVANSLAACRLLHINIRIDQMYWTISSLWICLMIYFAGWNSWMANTKQLECIRPMVPKT